MCTFSFPLYFNDHSYRISLRSFRFVSFSVCVCVCVTFDCDAFEKSIQEITVLIRIVEATGSIETITHNDIAVSPATVQIYTQPKNIFLNINNYIDT